MPIIKWTKEVLGPGLEGKVYTMKKNSWGKSLFHLTPMLSDFTIGNNFSSKNHQYLQCRNNFTDDPSHHNDFRAPKNIIQVWFIVFDFLLPTHVLTWGGLLTYNYSSTFVEKLLLRYLFFFDIFFPPWKMSPFLLTERYVVWHE